MLLEVTPSCVFQRDSATKRILASYDYKDIDYITKASDVPNSVIIANDGFARLHLFQCEDAENLIKAILDYAGTYIGISLRFRKEPITLDLFWTEKFGKYR